MIIKLSKKIIAIVLIVLLCMMYPLTITPVLGASSDLKFDENATLEESAKKFYDYYTGYLFGKVDYEREDVLSEWIRTYRGKYTVEELKDAIDKQYTDDFYRSDRMSIDRFLNDNYINNTEKQLEDARDWIAEWAKDFATSKGQYTRYSLSFDARANTYKDISPKGTGPFTFDCVGFVSYAILHATGIWYDEAAGGLTGYVTNSGVKDTAHFKKIDLNQAKKGDILIYNREDGRSGHVAIYLGGQSIVDCINTSPAVAVRTISNWQPSWMEAPFQAAATLISLDGVNFGELSGGVQFTGPVTDLDSLDYEFSGTPVTVAYAGGFSLMYYINKVGELFNYIFGVMFNGIKIVPVRIINGMYEIITNTFNYLNGSENTNET